MGSLNGNHSLMIKLEWIQSAEFAVCCSVYFG